MEKKIFMGRGEQIVIKIWYVNQANWINQRQNLIESYNKINILSRNKKYLIL